MWLLLIFPLGSCLFIFPLDSCHGSEEFFLNFAYELSVRIDEDPVGLGLVFTLFMVLFENGCSVAVCQISISLKAGAFLFPA